MLECSRQDWRGPVSVLRALAGAQADAGHTITICTTNCDYPDGILRHAGTESFAGAP